MLNCIFNTLAVCSILVWWHGRWPVRLTSLATPTHSCGVHPRAHLPVQDGGGLASCRRARGGCGGCARRYGRWWRQRLRRFSYATTRRSDADFIVGVPGGTAATHPI